MQSTETGYTGQVKCLTLPVGAGVAARNNMIFRNCNKNRISRKAIDNSNSAPFFLESIDVLNTCLLLQIPDLVNEKGLRRSRYYSSILPMFFSRSVCYAVE
jgi:hypothetical protein